MDTNANTTKTAKKKKKTSLPKPAKITLKILRFFLVPVLCIIALYVGVVIGYVTIGDGPASDVLDIETWKHLINLIFADR
ncbi:DNA-directed RNA polymerase subunit beta [Chengkuizengella axinellae]|uniref:DNA-directed RNA polymerase subunit beta n=1 Tax=Chengkuizengella axinellae TaxID=3064388 RepID=A0ABT9IZ40_9BACL|nr:DNA-directed RNA polymerase subunit beta [Chengkuizengella sp. 2205SS18-9]MDP5274639.1 DNA-directed RNA polymerase subunit beta [Chengkuizengella sp. 2205SS18-9]